MISARLAGAVILGVPLIVLAWVALRRQARAVFWFAVALILVGLGYLAATGATDDIARFLWPVAFDPGRRRHLETFAAANFDRILGAFLIVSPIWAVIIWIAWRRGAVPLIPSIILAALFLALHMTSYSARLARLVFPESVLDAPMRQTLGIEARKQ